MVAQEPFASSSTLNYSSFCDSDANNSQLARAGFFYRPTSSCPDNTTCYLCQSNLDGWEEDDNPTEEHLKHARNCGWAISVCIEQAIEDGNHSLEDPMSQNMRDARYMTFGSNWPHEHKRGWTCKTQKVCVRSYQSEPLLLSACPDGRCRLALLSNLRERRFR
jgi:hypothetical protein